MIPLCSVFHKIENKSDFYLMYWFTMSLVQTQKYHRFTYRAANHWCLSLMIPTSSATVAIPHAIPRCCRPLDSPKPYYRVSPLGALDGGGEVTYQRKHPLFKNISTYKDPFLKKMRIFKPRIYPYFLGNADLYPLMIFIR